MKNNIWILTIINVDPQELCDFETQAFVDETKAIEAFERAQYEWRELRKVMHDDFEDGSEDIFERWVMDSLSLDISNEELKYLHYVYDEGMEKVISLERKEA